MYKNNFFLFESVNYTQLHNVFIVCIRVMKIFIIIKAKIKIYTLYYTKIFVHKIPRKKDNHYFTELLTY